MNRVSGLENKPRRAARLGTAFDYATDVGVLGIMQAIGRLRGLVLLPVIGRILGTAAYGVWTQSLVAVAIGTAVVDMQISTAMVRFVSGTDDSREHREYFFSALALVVVLGALAAIGTIAASGAIAQWVLGSASAQSIASMLGVWIGLTALSNLSLNMLRARKQVKLFGVLTTIQVLAQLIIVAIIVVLLRDLTKAVLGAILVEFVLATFLLIGLLRTIGIRKTGLSKLRMMLSFSFPLVPSYFAEVSLNFADRLVIASRLGAGVVGVYAAAYSLARMVRVIYKPISLALLPVVSKAWDSGDRQQSHWLLSNTLRYYLLVAIPALVSVTVLGPTFILLLSGEISDPDLPVLIVLIGAGFLALCIQALFGVVLQLIQKTRLIALSKLISAAAYILLLVLAVPRWGMVGGALATAVGFGMDLVITVALVKREHRIRISPIFLIKLLIGGLLMAWVELLILDESLMRLFLAGLGGGFVFSAVVVMVGAIGKKEFRFLLNGILHLTRSGSGKNDK